MFNMPELLPIDQQVEQLILEVKSLYSPERQKQAEESRQSAMEWERAWEQIYGKLKSFVSTLAVRDTFGHNQVLDLLINLDVQSQKHVGRDWFYMGLKPILSDKKTVAEKKGDFLTAEAVDGLIAMYEASLQSN